MAHPLLVETAESTFKHYAFWIPAFAGMTPGRQMLIRITLIIQLQASVAG
jgi:hypothetical protein